MKRWYAVHTHSRAETNVVKNLNRQGFDTYLPLYLKKRNHARRIDWVPAPFFPRYLFVEMILETVRWRSIQSTIGVSNLVCFGEKPIPAPQNVITILRSHEDEQGLIKFGGQFRFDLGDQVQMLDGPFGDTTAVIKNKYGHDRVTLLLKMMGRQIKVNTSLGQILPVG